MHFSLLGQIQSTRIVSSSLQKCFQCLFYFIYFHLIYSLLICYDASFHFKLCFLMPALREWFVYKNSIDIYFIPCRLQLVGQYYQFVSLIWSRRYNVPLSELLIGIPIVIFTSILFLHPFYFCPFNSLSIGQMHVPTNKKRMMLMLLICISFGVYYSISIYLWFQFSLDDAAISSLVASILVALSSAHAMAHAHKYTHSYAKESRCCHYYCSYFSLPSPSPHSSTRQTHEHTKLTRVTHSFLSLLLFFRLFAPFFFFLFSHIILCHQYILLYGVTQSERDKQ